MRDGETRRKREGEWSEYNEEEEEERAHPEQE